MKDKYIKCRVSEEEKALVSKRAKELGFSSESKYIADKILKDEQIVNPFVMATLENIKRIIIKTETSIGDENKIEFNNEVKKLWQLLNW